MLDGILPPGSIAVESSQWHADMVKGGSLRWARRSSHGCSIVVRWSEPYRLINF